FEYIDNDNAFTFTDSSGRKSAVRSFGVLQNQKGQGRDSYRAQMSVGYRDGGDYAVDLSQYSKPHQIVLARTDRKETLAAILADVRAKRAKALDRGIHPTFNPVSTLLVPNMHWHLEHRYRELEKKDI